ncbi:MAG: hypothetical protein Q7R65_03960 [bacterium]|nr:hypothetical protein [bacterium]
MLEQGIDAVILGSFQGLWIGVITFLPRLLLAVIVFLLGWIVADVLGRLATQIISVLKVDQVLERTGIEEPLKRANIKLNSGAFIGGLIRWFFLVVFLVAVIDILGLTQVNAFLRDVVLRYIPQVIVAALILMVAVVVAESLQKIVVSSAKAARISSASILGGLVKWSIWVFAIFASLYQLGIAQDLIKTLITGFVAMLALAGGLAFGLGGKDAAAGLIQKMRKDISN